MGFHPPLLCAPPNAISPLVQHYPRDEQRDRERGQDPSGRGYLFHILVQGNHKARLF